MTTSRQPVHVLEVGASDVVMNRVKRAIDGVSGITIEHRAQDGVAAASHLRRNAADVIILDIGDTDIDAGVTIRRLKRIDPATPILMVSTLTFRNVKVGMKGLVEGAADYLQTPAPHTRENSEAAFDERLRDLVLALGTERQTKGARELPTVTTALTPPKRWEGPVALRPFKAGRPSVIAIASSTGGPRALYEVLAALPKLSQPVIITQHMPASFTGALAQHLTRRTDWDCVEAADGAVLEGGGRAHLAPGDYHLVLERKGGDVLTRINQSAPVNFCRPSADPMIESAIKAYGAEKVLAVVLTGMGSDGKDGAARVAEGGGNVIAQDQETSVVWGMPGAVARAGLCAAVLPLDEIADAIAERAG